MNVEVKVNELPESVADGTLLSWHKQPGDQVKADEALAEIETDKVVLEVAAPSPGVLKAQLRQKGETVKRGDVIATIEPSAEGAGEPAPKPEKKPEKTDAKPPAETAKTAVKQAETVKAEPAKQPAARRAAKPAPAAEREREPAKLADEARPDGAQAEDKVPDEARPDRTQAEDSGKMASIDGLAPSVRRLLHENKLKASDITGTGPRGRITKEDVVRHLEHSPHLASNIGEAATVVEISNKVPAVPGTAPGARPTTRVKMSRLRARIAERMVEAQHNAAILTTFNQVDMHALTQLRHNYRDAFQSQHGIKLGIMGFFVKACVEALRRYPVVNASVDGDDIVYHGYFDVGVAVSTTRGLVVPVLRDADKLGLADIERAIADYANRGEEGKLGIDELTGGTFTISNGGVFGSMLSTPILNPPQSAILGLHRIEERPVVKDGQIVIRPMMYLALSYDHRIIDGRDAVLFLVAVKELIEDPTRFILRV